MKVTNSNDNTDIKEWLRFAKADLTIAHMAMDNIYPPPLEHVCYNCEQTVEKSLKALLIMEGNEIVAHKKHTLSLLFVTFI